MELAVKAAGWVVGKALAPVTDGLLEAWAASNGLGPNVDALKMELLYAQAMLTNARGREIHNPALKEMLNKMRQLAYNADDLLDELEYFRIQDELDGTNHAADAHAEGCIKSLFLNARHTAIDAVAKLKPSSGSRDPRHNEQVNNAKQGCFSTSMCSCGGRTLSSSTPPPSPTNMDGNGRQFFCASLPSKVQGCLCSKRERSSAPPAPTTNQCDKKVDSGCLPKVTSTACNTVKSFGKCLPCCSFQSVDGNVHTGMSENPNMPLNGNRFLSCAWRSKVQQRDENTTQAPKLKFRRVDISEKMEDIIKHLKPVCAKVSDILNLEFMGTTRTTTKDDIAKKRPITTEYIAEDNKLYGRDAQKKRIVDGITLTHGEYFADELVVLPIVGPGGIGKTTFTRHVYDEVQSHFHVAIWICVSLNFNASRLAQEAVKKIPKVDGEKENSSDAERIEQRLKTKRFLLVLDDMWEYHEHEWEKLLAPFRKGGEKGNMVIVTTRSPKVAEMVLQKVDHPVINMSHLEDKDFMNLFEACVFVDQKPWEGDTKNLHDVGKEIVRKLKGFPLAAKTVGRLLRNQLTSEHWTRVLESKEWELQTNEDDIMPALKLSYDYLPFHLQQCFYYCGLFPEDYEFESKELVHFWIGLDIVHPSDLNRRIEDVGLEYLDDLVNHGFFKKNQRNGGCPVYVIHDLLHDLAVKISSFECLSINSSNVKSVQIPQDVRHLSIIVDNKDVEDIKTFKYYKNDLAALDKRLKVENLRTLMVFGEHHGSFVKNFCDLFERAGALRVIYLSGASYTVEDMLCNFSKLIHLRYLRIKSADTADMTNIDLPSALSIFYHLEVIDLQEWGNCSSFTRHMRNLAKLRYFLVPEHNLELHSNIVEVGKLRLLQELKSFEVGKESKGFELNQLGDLSELGGSLAIRGLERLQAIEEASEARLVQIKCLRTLTLQWDASVHQKHTTTHEEDALEILIPHSNLQELWIRGHGGTKCPQWLGESLSVKNLESLCLDGVAWKTFLPIGELWLVNEGIPGNIPDTRFQKLKRLELMKLPGLLKWAGHTPCQLFAHLEVLSITDCSELTELSFSHSTCCKQEKEANMSWFPKLQELKIEKCPKLLSFPPVPWTSAPCSTRIQGVGSGFEELICGENYRSEYRLKIKGKDGLDSTVWNLLAFDNLTELKELEMDRCPPLPLQDHFQMLSCLRTLKLRNSSSIAIPLVEGEGRAKYQFPIEIEFMTIHMWGASAKELTHLLTYFPKLSELNVENCDQITGLGVVEKQATSTPAPSPSANKVDVARIEQHQQQDGTRGEEEIAAETEGLLLLLPSQLQKLWIWKCPELILLRSDPIDDNREAGRTGGGQGLQGLTSLRSLMIDSCPRFLSSYSPPSSSPCFPFPTSLEHLSLHGAVGVETLPPLSKLTSLSDLFISHCGELRGEGLWPLLAQGHLTRLTVRGTPNFFAGSEHSPPELPSSSSKLQKLVTDDVAGVLVGPICAFLSSSLTELDFRQVQEVERFTKEQEEALQLLTSLERIGFWLCNKLQCLPAGLHRLPNLKRLYINYCEAIRSLPKDSLPSSLQELEIDDCPTIRLLPKDGLPSSLQELKIINCPAIRSIPKECLPNSLQKLVIRDCPAIRSLPKVDDLPSSLWELDAGYSNSEELRRQCCKLIGTIPIVRL